MTEIANLDQTPGLRVDSLHFIGLAFERDAGTEATGQVRLSGAVASSASNPDGKQFFFEPRAFAAQSR
jgi:hypothetical protein